MNRIAAIALFAAASFATLHSSASAQSRDVQVNVPFAFTVNHTTLPAGRYNVSSLSPTLLQVRSTDRTHPVSALVSAYESGKTNPAGPGALVFTQYGDQHFLHEFVGLGGFTDGAIPVSQQEQKARVESAGNKNSGQPVVIALK